MGLWLTEREFRQGGAESTGVTLNVAFLRDIKQDTPSLGTQSNVIRQSLEGGSISPRHAVDLLTQYRDDLETYFALEEFYGYFSNAAVTNPTISSQAARLRTEHVELFLNLNQVIELAEQILYHECSTEITLRQVTQRFDAFVTAFESHENSEMELMMRLCNEELGGCG